jgi:hypothetical protein
MFVGFKANVKPVFNNALLVETFQGIVWFM